MNAPLPRGAGPRRDGGRERVARLVYSILWVLLTPAIAVYLLWRARKQPEYRQRWAERFIGRYRQRPRPGCIWVHAVSVGETRAAAPLVERLLVAHPTRDVVVTHMTPTGRATAESLFGDRIVHAYLAYDYPFAVAAFLRHFRPAIGIVMETEIWPNLMAAAERTGTPMILANARLSAKSLVAARRWSTLMRPALARFTRVLAQGEADAKRFALLAETEWPSTASNVATVGNMKFDVVASEAQRSLGARFRRRAAGRGDEHEVGGEAGAGGDVPRTSRRVLLCASTREGEEEGIVDAWLRHGASTDGRTLLAIVPRHPQRFDAVADLVAARGLALQRRSDERAVAAATQVWLGDSMGELWAYYVAADVAYVGGSIAPLGGQNLIEAAAAGCPVLIGRHTHNFGAASDEAVRVGAAVRVVDYDALIATGIDLLDDDARRQRMADAGVAFAASHRGATARTVAIVERVLNGIDGDTGIE